MSEEYPPADQGAPGQLKRFTGERRAPSILLAGLLVLAVLYTLYFARALLLPVVLATLLAIILMPAVRALRRLHVPRALGAALVVVALASTLAGLGAWVYEPAAQWIEKAPATLAEMESKLRGIRKSVAEMAKVAEKVEQLATPAAATTTKPQPPAPQPRPGLLERTFSTTVTFLVTTGTTLVLLYFLLATGDMLLQRTVGMMPTRADKKRVVEVARRIESQMARYLGTVTLINAGLGIATGLAMHWLGMPNPVLWGVMAFAFNYFPYLGPAASLVILTFVAALTFDQIAEIALVPAVFFAFTVLEGQFLAPLIIGRHLTLNPVLILLSMLFWAWLWGVVGALLAVPLLVAFKCFCEHHDSLKPLGELIAGQPTPSPVTQLGTEKAVTSGQ